MKMFNVILNLKLVHFFYFISIISQSIFIENQSEMNLGKSTNRYQTPSKGYTEGDLQAKVIDQSLRKSYFFQALPKSTRQLPSTIEEFQMGQSKIINKQQTQRRKRIFQSVMKTANKIQIFRLLMVQVSPQSPAYFSCCTSSAASIPVTVQLSQFKDVTVRKEAQLLFHFNFNTVEASIVSDEKDSSSFILNVCNKIVLKFENATEDSRAAIKLKQALTSMVEGSLGKQFHMQDLKDIESFEKVRYKPVTQFAEHCQTGDIILFKGSLFWAKLQRFVLNSQYDHVGLIYKDPIHGILIFEATSFNGICLTPWEYVLKYKWYTFIQKIAWRKLTKVQRTYEFMQKMREIIINKLGQTYHISLDKLMSNKSYIYKKPPSVIKEVPQDSEVLENPKEEEKQKTEQKKSKDVGYFCSELVAKMYKELKILTSDEKNVNYKPSCNYYPYHFTEKFNLNMMEGQLSEEYVIHFNDEEINSYYNFQ